MEGTSTKMSASALANTVFLTDTPEMISEKVRC
jgi:tryptophanyl-tRNA synthetase